MTIKVLQPPSENQAFDEHVVDMDGQDFILNYKFNSADSTWYLDIRTENNEPIKGCESIRLVQGGRPLHAVTDENAPKGALFLLGPESKEPGFENLGTETVLIYIPEADLGQYGG